MKKLKIRLQIIAILLIFASPFIYLLTIKFLPYIKLAKFDLNQVKLSANYPKLDFLKTDQNRIVDSSDNEILLRGVNIASTTWGKEYEEWNPVAVERAASDWGANVIRTRIHEYEFTENPANFFLKLETQILEPARKNGLYVILHPWFGENQSIPDKNGEHMWLAVAKRYKDDPQIIFDLFAEPRDIQRSELYQSYNSLIPQVRKVAPRSLIMVTGLDWGREINSFLDEPLPYTNLVYRTNPYNRTGEFEGLFGKIAEFFPVFIGEFGADEKLSMKNEDIKNLLAYANKLNLGWTAWHFSSSGCPCLLEDNQSFTTTQYGEIVRDALFGKTIVYPTLQFPADSSRFYVYSDFFENGFTDYSWLAPTNLRDSNAINGQYSFSAIMQNRSGIYFHTSRTINPQQFKYLNMRVISPITLNLALRLRDNADQLSPPYHLADFGDQSLFIFPLRSLDIDNISGISLELIENIDQPANIVLDDIYFSN